MLVGELLSDSQLEKSYDAQRAHIRGEKTSFWPWREVEMQIPDQINSWDELFITLARVIARKSKDPSTKCGCVIVGDDHAILTMGYNGLPRGCNDNVPERSIRPDKYLWTEHAERNGVCNAAANGIRLRGATAYVTGPPCADCSRAMIQAGIKKIVIPKKHNMLGRKDWEKNLSISRVLLEEAKVEYEEWEE